jgi:hypothetical protein
MSRRSKQIWAVLGLVAMVCFTAAWPAYKKLSVKPVSASLMEKTKKVVEKNPQLQPDCERAMEDGVLAWPEAKPILEKAGEKAELED